jgi:hypothetical protein
MRDYLEQAARCLPPLDAERATVENDPMCHPRRIEGFAIVSQDGMLANAAGIMPTSLKFEADQRFFETCLDAVKPTTQPCPSSVASLSSRPLI